MQNLLALRFANTIFEPIWNRTWVDSAQITVRRDPRRRGRGGFYETAGAMRDIVQNHVLQVLSLFLMEPPTSFHPEAIRDEKVKLLRAIRPMDGERTSSATPCAANTPAAGRASDLMAGYREEPGVDPLSKTETFVALRLDIDNWRWSDVPIYVRTGKRLPQRMTKVTIQFRRPPHLPLFPRATRLEPDAWCCTSSLRRASACASARRSPGTPSRSAPHRWTSPTARVSREVAGGLRTSDPRRDHRRPDPVHPGRRGRPVVAHRRPDHGVLGDRRGRPIPLYQAASWGPREAGELIERDGRSWLE